MLDQRYGVVNVIDKGANPTGSTDSAGAFQRALDAAAASAPLKTLIYVPPGTYMLESPLSAVGGITVLGANMYATTLKLASGVNSEILATPNDGVQRYDLQLHGLTLDGNAANQSGGDSAIHLYGMNEPLIENVRILNPYGHGIHIGGSTQKSGVYNTIPRILNCLLRGDQSYSTGHGVYLDTGSSDGILSVVDAGYFKQGSGIAWSDHAGSVATACNSWQNQNGYSLYAVSRLRALALLSDLAQHDGFILQNACTEIQLSTCKARDSGQAGSGYDGLRVEGASGALVEDVTINNFHALAGGAGGISLAQYMDRVTILGGDVSQSNGGLAIGTTSISNLRIDQLRGYNPVGQVTETPPASGSTYTNTSAVRQRIFLTGGSMSALSINGTATGITATPVNFELDPGETFIPTYSSTPTMTVFGL